MHELSIAVALVEMACEKAEELGDVRVEALHLRLGPLSGVVREALLSAFELAAEGTAIAGARLAVEDTPLTILCARCAAEHTLLNVQQLCCPVCAQPPARIVRGRELELRALEVRENAARGA